jgi:succinate-semialdehyde dehydrogenase/glutarate-semialdehyde dehydrogenase
MPDSVNPATGQRIARYAAMPLGEVRAVAGAVAVAAPQWARRPMTERAGLLEELSAELLRREESLALLITREMGKPVRESRVEIQKCAWVCRYYAENGPQFLADQSIPTEVWKSLVSYEPLGVILAVMPWNFPLWQVFRFAAPALLAGNGAILKHASNVTGCSLAIEELVRAAGFPENLFRSVVTDAEAIGKLIADDSVQGVTLAGIEAAGRAVAAAAGRAIKKSVLELGGSDPYLVLADATLELAARKCAQARLVNNGQTCIAAKRFIVERPVREAFLEKLAEALSSHTTGDPEDEATDLGPMARADLREELQDQVDRALAAGARLLMGGRIPEGQGYFYPVTLLDEVKPGNPAAVEEVFGPVAVVMEAENADAAVQLANQSDFGLGAAVFTRDLRLGEAMARQLKAGVVAVNDFVRSDPRLPFGGIRHSGYGRELADHGIREFTNIKSIVIET